MLQQTVIEALRSTFALFGLPDSRIGQWTMVHPCFVGQEFRQYLQQNELKQITAATYHLATNGLVERAVQVGLKKVRRIQTCIAVLFIYRITPQSTMGVSPAELLMGIG